MVMSESSLGNYFSCPIPRPAATLGQVNALSDPQLLRAYAERRSEAAFAELVRRHIDFVHSAALRMVNDAHLAKDVSQGVFVALAKDAGKLTDHPVLSGWLHRTARNIAAQTIRTEVRRRHREHEAAAMHQHPETDASWEEIAPQLDAALSELAEPDRDAVLLRYFENKPAHEMAAILGISAEAAQKRVSRAVERLRDNFAKRGVTAGAAGLAGVISANAVHAAPAGLAALVSGAAIVATTSATAAATTILAMTTIQKALAVVALAVLGGIAIHQTRQASQLRQEVRDLRKQRDQPLTKHLSPDQKPERNSTRAATVVKPDFSAAIRDSALLSSSERSRKMQMAAMAMSDAEFADIQQALLQLPAGTDSFGAFNSLAFYMCLRDCPRALALFAEWVADESFPREWLYSAASNGLATFGRDHPLEAIKAAQDATIHTQPLGKAALIASAIRQVDASHSQQVSRELLKLDAQSTKNVLAFESTVRLLIRAGDLNQAMANVKSGNDPLPRTGKAMIGREIAESAGFEEGLKFLGAADRSDPDILTGYYGKWIQLDPNRTLEKLPRLEAYVQDRVIEENVEFLATWGKSSALEWAQRIQEPELRASALRKLGQ